MSRRAESFLRVVPCRRCETLIYALKQPLMSSNETWKRFRHICQDCITPAEQEEIIGAEVDDAIDSLRRRA